MNVPTTVFPVKTGTHPLPTVDSRPRLHEGQALRGKDGCGVFLTKSEQLPRPLTRGLRLVLASLLALVSALSAGCGRPAGDELLVFAAASLADALREVGDRYEQETGARVAFSFGGSQALARQISGGAPADVFVAAGQPPVDFLALRDEVEFVEEAVVHNELVVAVREGSAALQSMSELAGSEVGRIAVADPVLAPAGVYAREALRSLGLWEPLRPRLVFGADVRAALAYLESGNVDAAIVYATDAREAPGVRALDIVPQDSYTPVAYPAAVIAGSESREAAVDFVRFLESDAARGIFKRHGFRVTGVH